MQVSKKKILLLIVFVASVWLVVAQRHRWIREELPDATTELRRIVISQQQTDSLLVDGNIRLYDEKGPDALLETLSFRYYRNGASFYSRFGSLVVVGNKQWIIEVDSSSQRIIVQKQGPTAGMEAISAATGIQLMEKIWQDTAVFKLHLSVKQKGRQRVLHMESEQNPEMRSAALTYDPATARLEKAEIRWRKDGQADGNGQDGWVSYISYTNRPAFFLDIENIMGNIVVLKDGLWRPASGYAAYQLIEMDKGIEQRERME